MKFKLIIFSILAIGITSCGIQKRTLMDGFYIPSRSSSNQIFSNDLDQEREAFVVDQRIAELEYDNADLYAQDWTESDEDFFEVTDVVHDDWEFLEYERSEFMSDLPVNGAADSFEDPPHLQDAPSMIDNHIEISNQPAYFDIEGAVVESDSWTFQRFSQSLKRSFFGIEPSDVGTDGLSIAAMCCGIFGLLVFGFGVLGIIFGAIGLAKTSRTGRKGKGMAITGLVTGIIKVLLILALLL
ncbi:MAG TPA: hypothetical protein DCS80_07575 [Betaproteobacteria bacterium]|nr:hypothetical protein [Betaproteobacteria bacterium]